MGIEPPQIRVSLGPALPISLAEMIDEAPK